MGSVSTSLAILPSLIMKLVAQVSSSTRRVVAPISRASTMLAAWLVLPLASPELGGQVSTGSFFLLLLLLT